MIALTMTFDAEPGAEIVAPMGLPTPAVSPLALSCEGARLRIVGAPNVAQMLVSASVEAHRVALRYEFAPGGPAYPEQLFRATDSRFTRAAVELASEAREVADAAGGGAAGLQAIVDHVAALFDYGHPDERFYDGHDVIPHLCGTTRGSCVDINAYLIAALRSAGFEAGYAYGAFIPEEKKISCADPHCWVVTRHADLVQEWDVAHHLKMGSRVVRPALNPKPGVRVALSHSMGWEVPSLGIADAKIVGAPMLLQDGALTRAKGLTIAFEGYEDLAATN